MTQALVLVMAALLSTPSTAVAQSAPAASDLRFEEASIRVNATGGPSKTVGNPPTRVAADAVITPQGNRLVAINATVRALVRFAYGSDGDLLTPPLLDEYRVVGGPSWIDSELFDIVAQMPEAAGRRVGDPALMLRALLGERFSLRLHTETRELPAYRLVRARPGTLPGPQLRPPSGTCVPPAAPDAREQRRCGVRRAFQGIIADGVSMTHFAAALSQILGRAVVDQTNLAGLFDFDLRFTDDLAPDARFPSLFTAVQEQLQLKLESTRAALDVMVIDSVERPSAN